MNTDLQGAQVNALKLADTFSTELANRNDLQLFFAQVVGARKSSLQINRHEYLLNKIYPIVYQHMIADAPLSEDALVEGAKIVAAQINGIVVRASESAAQDLVKTPQWEEAYKSIHPMDGLRKTPWDLQNPEVVEDAVYFVARLVYVNCSSSISPDNANKWSEHFVQKSFGLIANNNSNSNLAYTKSKGFAAKLMKSGWLEDFSKVYEKHLFAQITQSLEASRNLVATHTQSLNVNGLHVDVETDAPQDSAQSTVSVAKMNHR